MVGPVLHLELLLAGRRSRQYVFRWIYAAWLIGQLLWTFFVTWFFTTITRAGGSVTADVARQFVATFVAQQFLLLLLATPAITAGAITDEKTSGTLQYLLTTDLSAGEVVLGKLLGCTAQVVVLWLTGLPLLCFIGVFGGVEMTSLLGLFCVNVPPLFGIAAASLLASVWTQRTRDAVLGLYAVLSGGALLLASDPGGVLAWLEVDGLLKCFDPLYVLEPSWGRPDAQELAETGYRLLGSAALWGTILIVCLILGSWRLRPAYRRQLESLGQPVRRRGRPAKARTVGDDPIEWKEEQIDGLAPLPILRRVPRRLAAGLVTIGTIVIGLIILRAHLPGNFTWGRLYELTLQGQLPSVLSQAQPADGAFFWLGALVMLIASLTVGIRASGAISGERAKMAWEALLLSPLPVRDLVRGKLRGILRCTWPYLGAYFVPAVVLSLGGGVAAFMWTVLWAPMTWLAMYFVGAAGVWCSARAKSSWRALLSTLGWAYLGGFIVSTVTTPVVMFLTLFVWALLFVVDQFLHTAFSGLMVTTLTTFGNAFVIAFNLALALIFYLAARYFLAEAERWVAERERTRHWKEEAPVRRGQRRPARPHR
jgi:ABC-type transport system involved in multi-copper enzyme maturation permease subunit